MYYFGEKFDEAKCNKMCDNCADPKESVQVLDEVMLVLTTIDLVKEKHQMKHIVQILMGKENAEVKTYSHQELEQFGAGEDKDPSFWFSIMRHLLVKGLLHKDIETYGKLVITDAGRAYMAKPTAMELFLERNPTTGAVAEDAGNYKVAAVGDPILIDMIKALRKKEADRLELAPYVLFQDPSIEDMAIQYPITLDELTHIAGVGAGKAKKFGKSFVALIAKYVEENEVERPMDMVVKSVANRSANKVHIITNIDKRLPLEDIAKSKGMKMEEIMTEIEAIVFSGTKVNINYYLDDLLDEDSQEEIFDYFKEAENDTIEAAHEEFDGDYSEDELRLVRIRFMSEVAN